jgi:dihydroxyacetone kinase
MINMRHNYCTSPDMPGYSLTLVKLVVQLDRLLATPAEVAACSF